MKTRVSGIIVSDGKLLLIHRRKEGKEYWVFPGGGVEEGEINEEAMAREIEEETSLKATNIRFALNDPTKWDDGKNVFYYCVVDYAKPELGGPEKKKLSADDWYQPEWVELSKCADLEIYPAEGKKLLVNSL